MINYWYEFSATNEYHLILRGEFSLPVPKRAASRALNLWWVGGEYQPGYRNNNNYRLPHIMIPSTYKQSRVYFRILGRFIAPSSDFSAKAASVWSVPEYGWTAIQFEHMDNRSRVLIL